MTIPIKGSEKDLQLKKKIRNALDLLTKATVFSYVDYLRNVRVEFYNKCHNPEGPQGGQFCSENIDLSGVENVDRRIAKRLRGVADVISSVHDLPRTFPKTNVILGNSSIVGAETDMGNTDGLYDSATDTIRLNEDNITGIDITFVHEFGHHVSLGEEGNFSLNQFQDKIDRSTSLSKWRETVQASDTIKGLTERQDKTKNGYDEYLLDDREIFARSYAQWIAVRSGDATLTDQLERNRSNNPNFQWQDDEFEPIAQALDEHFKTSRNTTS